MTQREHENAVSNALIALKDAVDKAQTEQGFKSINQSLYEKIDAFVCETINDNFKQ